MYVWYGTNEYNFEVLKNPLADQFDNRGTLLESPALASLRALKWTDGSPVLNDMELVGWEFIGEVLIELGHVDDEAFRALGYDKWSEENQRSARNAPFVFHSVLEVLKRKEAQENDFVHLLALMICPLLA